MDAQLEIKLIECLDALAQGESIERILARYPQEADQLRPMLYAAAGLPTLRMEPSEAAKIQSRQKFLAQAEMLRRTSPRKTLGLLPRFATGFVAAALVAIVLGTGAVAASGSALPGDPLYGLKRTVENARLQSASSSTQQQELQREFEQRRIEEINRLLAAQREGEVEFTGIIEVMQPEAWVVSSLVVQIDPATQIVGTPQLNRVAEVRGVTGPQGLRASSISIESAGELELTPIPEATETPQATETPEPTRTIEPQITITPPPSVTPRPTATARPTATVEPVEVEFTGTVDAINAETWIIDNTTVSVDANTRIDGAITVGQRVKVEALRFADGRLVATRIERSDDGGNSGSPGSGNSNSNENQNNGGSNANDNGNDAGGNSNDENENEEHSSNDNGGEDDSNDNDN